MFPERIETDSLVLRPVADVDAVELYDRFADADAVFEYVPQEPYETVKQAHEDVREAGDDWADAADAEYGVFVDGDLAGRAVLAFDWARRTGSLGVILAEPFWGRGYAGECARALTEVAFERLDLEVVAIGHEEGNDRSKRAVEKFVEDLGGGYDGVLRNWTPVGDEVLDHHRYTVTREQYERSGE